VSRIKRRLLLSAGAILALPLSCLAQPAGVRRIAMLEPGTFKPDSATWREFLGSLKAAGYVEGRDIVFEIRVAAHRLERLPALASELVALRPDVLLTYSTPAVAAAKGATRSIPIVFAGAGNPVGWGFVASYARPGGNITGVANAAPGDEPGLDGKVLELIRETLPGSTRIGVLTDPADPSHARYSARIAPAAKSLRFELIAVPVSKAEDFEGALLKVKAQGFDAVYVTSLNLFSIHAARLGELALKSRTPVFARSLAVSEAGGLMSLDSDLVYNWRQAGKLVARILGGAKPKDLPVEQPDRFRLAVNVRAAKAIGITIPSSVLLRADKVIE
jgi:putative ABC transport system substrate-binding protein